MNEHSTESAAKRFSDSHNWSSPELVEGILDEQALGITAVQNASIKIAVAIEEIVSRLKLGGRLVFAGAGTSGRIAAQDATELLPTYNWPIDRAIVLMAGGTKALHSAVEGAEDDTETAERDVRNITPSQSDVFIGVAASGNTPYTLKCLQIAKRHNCYAVGIFNNKDSQMPEVADCPIFLDTGSEFVTGSTRMKAGTSQKAALNTITTSVMIRLGRVYRGQMIDMPATNKKLTKRCIRIVERVCDCEPSTAMAALESSGWNVKLAIVMISQNVSLLDAKRSLEKANGLLQAVLETRSQL